MAKISVIVPVYKVEDYLDRCVRSVLRQTHTDWELILVDDGSPDRSGALCDSYAKEDSRVHVIHQTNGGLSAARNAGLDWLYAEGEGQWITFLDSDDWLHPEMLAKMLSAAQTSDTNISICGYGETYGESVWTDPGLWKTESWLPEDFYRQKFINATIACAKLYHRRCFETVRFPMGKLHEDEFVTYRLLFGEEKLAFIDAPLYAYYVNTASITKGPWRPKRLDAWEAYEEQIAFFRERGMEEMARFRLRGYLENALVNLENAKNAPNAAEVAGTIPFIEKRIRRVIRRCWHGGCIHFQYDFDILLRFYPFLTRGYRFWLEKTEGLRR